uniref:RRM domain-containing protein n=1 Tax=Sus scrofa TaxID=9823 RepID=A0A8D0R9Q9_PIG
MWPFLSRALFPPPTEAWLQRASSDPEAQGWGAWSRAEKTPLGAGGGGREAEETVEAQAEDEGDTGFLPSLLEREGLAEATCPLPRTLWHGWGVKASAATQHPGAPSTPGINELQETLGGEARAGALTPGPVPQVDYEGTARELEAYFNHCGEIHRVTILCDKFSGHPKGYAYIEFATESSAHAAVELDNSVFRGRVIKVLPKRTNFPGISSTDRGGLRGHPSARGRPFPHSIQLRPRLSPCRGRGRGLPWYSPY